MNTVIDFLLFALAWIVGGAIGAFTVVQSLIIVRFGIPLAVHLNNKGAMSNYAPVRRYIISFLFLSLVLAISSVAVFSFFPRYIFPYLLGLTITFLWGNNAARLNKDNLADFLQSNAKYLTRGPDEFEKEEVEYLFSPNPRNASSMAGNEIFARVFGESISNIIFYGIGAVVIFFISNFSWWIGIILFGAFALFLAISALQFIFTSGLGLIAFVGYLYRTLKGERGFMGEQSFLMAASFVQGVEHVIYAFYLLYLYRVFF
jgi:hypothetical protein